jgi:hypothetical protein
MTQIAVSLISAIGALTGVILGALLTSRFQRSAWLRQEAVKSIQERRVVYASFIATAREWRANVMSPEAKILTASTISRGRHAAGGEAEVKTLRLQAELGLVAFTQGTVLCSDGLISAVRRLAEARGSHDAGQVPDPIVQRCRDAEREFLKAARIELGSPDIAILEFRPAPDSNHG